MACLALKRAVVALLGLAVLTNASIGGDWQTEPPKAIPANASATELRFQPALDFDQDGCYNVPAIDIKGNVDKGLANVTNVVDGMRRLVIEPDPSLHCRNASDLKNNQVYSRGRCNNGWCFILYDYYFEIDVALYYGEPWEWEHIGVWIYNNATYSVSATFDGVWETRNATNITFLGDAPKMVYHRERDWKHGFRFLEKHEEFNKTIENHTGDWFKGALLSWGGWPSKKLRDKLMNYDFRTVIHKHQRVGVKDGEFEWHLEITKPWDFTFNKTWHDENDTLTFLPEF